jgi:glycosyltransferase involved in cell wall biosynthesis
MAQQWIKLGHQVQVVTCFPNHPVGRVYPGYQQTRYAREILHDIVVHRNWTYITPNKGFLRKSIGHFSFWPSSLICTLPRMQRPDVIIGTSPTFFAAMSAALAGRCFKVPFIMEVRDLWPACFVELGVIKNKRIIKLLEKWELSLYRRADKIVTVTEAFRQNLIDRFVPAQKVYNVPNGADENYWKPPERKPEVLNQGGPAASFNVLYIGAHGISQALSKVLDAARLLKSETSIRFIFVGEGAEKEKLKAQASEQDLTNVSFFDPVDKEKVRDFYSAADVCLVPLRDIPLFKTFIPSKMFEMMAMERPIIASLTGEAAEILKKSGGAIVVPPEDSRAIADGILELQRSPARRKEMGRVGRNFVTANYSRRALAAKFISILEDARQTLQ